MNNPLTSFYKDKTVLITGHTGFKGSWLCRLLLNAGASIVGYSLEPPTDPCLYDIADIDEHINSHIADIRDIDSLRRVFNEYRPEIVFHLAAQPIVLEGYRNPRETYETNVMGTVNVLESIRQCDSVRSFVNVTTDKVYRNNEWCWGYREDDYLNGFDPYSNSKSCSELVTSSYRNSFFSEDMRVAISSARAGNVLGGGDFAANRIIPDCVRAATLKTPIKVRNPYSIRPYQHVLEPLSAYLLLAMEQNDNVAVSGAYNIGPDECDCVTTGELVSIFCQKWGNGITWYSEIQAGAPHEANYLKLDCNKIKNALGWKPRWHIEKCMEMVCAFSRIWLDKGTISKEMDREIAEYFEGGNDGILE